MPSFLSSVAAQRPKYDASSSKPSLWLVSTPLFAASSANLTAIGALEAILLKIASNAPIAVKFALEAVNKGMDTSQSEGLLLEASYFGLCAATEDKKEGTSAFLEKRAPQFHGR